MVDYSKYDHFFRNEFDYPDAMNEDLLEKLDSAREEANVPFVITSDYRPNDPRAHGRGNAVDIACITSSARYRIVTGLLSAGFNRLGVYDKHIHADIDPQSPPHVMWWDQSR